MVNSTLCYLERGDEYLMLHRVKKKHDLNRDKWIGVGGKFQEGESPEECILRETWEETGLTLTDYRYRGLVTFVSNQAPTEYMHLFTARGWQGTPHPCDEGELAWIKKADLLALPMWEGDRLFLRLLEEDAPFFSLKLVYRGDTLVQAALNGRPLPLRGPEPSLVPLSAEHLEALADLWAREEVIRYTSIPAACAWEDSARRLERLLSCQEGLPGPVIFAVLEAGAFCGIAGCPPVDAARGRFGLFYQLLPEAWGRGAGLAAASLALESLYGLFPSAEVYADTVAANTASVRILERLGFVRTKVRQGAFSRAGQALDIWEYARRAKKEERI